MSKQIPNSQPAPQRAAFSFDRLRDTGVLWLINRCVFHPRGFALALDYAEGEEQPRGWSIQGNGAEVWAFTDGEDEKFAAVESLLDAARSHGRAPLLSDADSATGQDSA